jgi:hypothetical protein
MEVDQPEHDPLTSSGIYEIPEGYDAENWVNTETGNNDTAQDVPAQSFQHEEQDPNLQDFQ